MKPFHNLLVALFVLSALQAQTPWTNWGIYRDSTGNGANPVSGGLVCSDDTLWLIVDTTGMGAAGVTGWRWTYNGPTPQVVYCTGSSCPSTLPDFFPFSGLSDKRKLGIKPLASTGVQAFILTTYYTNGDSIISVKSYTIRGGSASLNLPTEACPNTNVAGSVDVSGVLDSFIVTYGTTTIRNQTNFNVAIPSGSGTLTVTLTYYVCGNPTSYSSTISYPITLTPPSPITITSSGNSCPTSPVNLVTSVPAGYTSFVWTINGTPVTTGTNHPVSYNWLPSGPGTYTIAYTATYPCGTMTNSTTYTISTAPTPSLTINVFPSPYCPGQTFTVFATASPGSSGLYAIDIGNDGTIEAYSNSASSSVSSIPSGGLPIRVQFSDGCGGTADDTIFYNPPLPSQPVSAFAYPILPSGTPRCPNSPITVTLQTSGFPIDSIKNIQWSWDGTNWTSPSNNPTVTLTTPNTPGPWTLHYQFTANSPAPCLTPPTSPSTFAINPPNMGPQFIILGSLCPSGGTIRLVPQSFSTSGMDSIRYTLPNGTVINKGITDTLVVSIPAGTSTYTVAAQGYTACGLSMPSYKDIPSQQASIQSFSTSPSSGCSGTSYSAFVSFPPNSGLDSVVVVLWNGQRVPLNILFGSANGSFAGPTTPGNYTLTAIMYTCAGNDTATRTIQVSAGSGAVANFTAPSSACVGVPVTFQRTGSNAGITYANWFFGDGSASDTSLSVTHTYTAPGTYTVNLSVQSVQCGFSNYQRTIQVYGAPPTLSGLNVTSSGLTINYSVATASDYDQIVWNFGDGNTAAGVLSGTHTYASAGSYTVKVQAINACDTTELTTTISVTTGLLSGGAGAWVVYPNPARQEVFFSHPTYQGDLKVELYDLTGRLVQTEALSSYPARVRLSLPNGLYTLRLISREGITTTKLLVE